MIQAPNELREVAEGATVNLFVSVGRTSRRLKGTVEATRERGTDGEVLEVRAVEDAPGAAEIVFWLGFTDAETFLLPLDAEAGDLVYVNYRHGGGRTGLYVDGVRHATVTGPTDDARADVATTAEWPSMDEKARIDRSAKSERNSRR